MLTALENIAKRHPHVWVELTTLVIPGLNDSDEEMTELASWVLKTFGDRAVLHLSRYFPCYKMKVSATPPETLVRLRQVAMNAGIRFVYIGNVRLPGAEDTCCPNCNEVLIQRRGYTVKGGNFRDGKCEKCGTTIPGVWS